MPHSKSLPQSTDSTSPLYKLQHGGRRSDWRWLARWRGHDDGWWPEGPRWGPPSRRGWSLANREYERARREAIRRRGYLDAATPDQLTAARRWLMEEAREHEADDATPKELLHMVERLHRPDGWTGFVRTLEGRPE